MIGFESVVLDIIQRTHDVKSFRFRMKDDVSFNPGQFFFVTIMVDGLETTKPFSFSNSPTEKGYAEFTKRITASAFSKALDRIKIGDSAKLKMPSGGFSFTGEYKKIAFLSGGIGITPIRSICKFIIDKKLSVDAVLFYGNNREGDIVFRPELDSWGLVNKNLRVVYTLAASDADKWPGRTGYIDDKMIKDEIPDYQDRVFYICGPPAMVAGLSGLLKNRLGISDDRIKIENFTGY